MKNSIKDWINNADSVIESHPDQARKRSSDEIMKSLILMRNALKLKANAGGKIKVEIRKVLEILQDL